MTNYGLRARVITMTLAPTLIIGLLLSTFFVVNRYRDLNQQLIDEGISIIEPLSVATEYAMTFRNRESVKQLINLLHRRHSNIVRSIAVFDADNRLFVTSNFHRNFSVLQLDDQSKLPTQVMVTRQDQLLVIRTPIFAENSLPELLLSNPDNNPPLGYIAVELDVKPMELQQYQEIAASLGMLAIGMIIAGVFSYRLMRVVTVPITHMVHTVDQIRRGQLDSRVAGNMLGELNMLKNGINSMAVSLTVYHEEMQQSIDQATSDLRETLEQMEIQNVELDLAKKRAQEAARIKSEFLANMSHELRTPLNGVIGFTRQMLKTRLSTSQIDYLQTIERSANNLLTIINDILDFSKLEAGKLVLEQIPFGVHDTIDEVILLLAPNAHDKGIELTLTLSQDVPEYVVGDPLRIQQILTNLIGNAIKFTEHGNIDILIELRSHTPGGIELLLQIKDTGIGISERQQAQLFQAFRQADASISRRYGGTGLGLVITQKLVKEMGGEIGFQSRLHKGSSFWFTVPLALTDSMHNDVPKLLSLAGQHISVIESNEHAASAVISMFEQQPVILHCAATLTELTITQTDILLLCFAATLTPDVADMSKQIKQARRYTRRVIVGLPSKDLNVADALIQAGAEACLTKPLPRARLFNTLQDGHSTTLPTPVWLPAKLPLHVMAVDDNPANLKLIGTLLQEMVEHVYLCNNGLDAVEQASHQPFDIILMDIQMPEMDGIRASELIHQQTNNQHTPIIAVTAHAMSGERERLMAAGMDDYLTKPIDESMLQRIMALHTGCNLPITVSTAALPCPAKPYPGNSAPILISKTDAIPAQNTVVRDITNTVATVLTVETVNATETTETVKTVIAGNASENSSLDWALALQQAAGKEDLAIELLEMLLTFLTEIEQRVHNVLNEQDEPEILAKIHTLHGSCSYSGVPRLKNLCRQLEQLLRQGTSATELEPEWLELLDEIENVRHESLRFIPHQVT
ncbi:MAG: two-component sensor histidine kinase BarA [Plesiomonas sp.]|uniref:two-component sensor histidine kinase BarA n=1 Tax=Plesiomonas sp. TaxID=2486279 RepID=UPI003F41832C